MKSLVVIYVLAVVSAVGAFMVADRVINDVMPDLPPYMAYSEPVYVEPLTIRNDGYSSSADAVQPVVGGLYYQGGTGVIQGSDKQVARVVIPRVVGDVDGNGAVNAADTRIVRAHFGQTNAGYAQGDVNEDGVVDELDLSVVLQHQPIVDTSLRLI